MKKTLTSITALLLAISTITACGNNATSVNNTNSTSTSSQTSTESKTENEAETSKPRNENTIDYSNADFKAQLLSVISDIDTALPVFKPVEIEGGKCPDDGDPFYENSYCLDYESMFNIISGYLKRNDKLTNAQYEEWCAAQFKKADENPTDLKSTVTAYPFIKDFNIKFDDIKEELLRCRNTCDTCKGKSTDDCVFDMSDQEWNILFNGTEQEVTAAFYNKDYSILIGNKIYTPKQFTENMTLEECIKVGLTPEMIAEKEENFRKREKDYGDMTCWVTKTEQKLNVYKAITEKIWENQKSDVKDFDVKNWIKDNEKMFAKISDKVQTDSANTTS